MRKSNYLAVIGAAMGMLLLILDGRTALTGAMEGIGLCLRSVIPSLFPFFVLSCILTGSLTGQKLPLLSPLGKLCGIPAGGESLLLIGFLGGYPVGARSIAAACRSGSLARSQGERMLAFCNNAGPAFLFGMIGPMFSDSRIPWVLWFIHMLSAVLVSLCIPCQQERISLEPSTGVFLAEAMAGSVKTMGNVCGWVILFRIAAAFLEKWVLWLLPVEARVSLIGMLELSNGCSVLSQIADEGLRMLVCSGILSFGGACVAMQTASVIQGLSGRYYFPGKLLQTAFSILLCWLLLPKDTVSPALPAAAACIALFFGRFLRKMQNSGSIPQPVGV